jgi:hypothetical protein
MMCSQPQIPGTVTSQPSLESREARRAKDQKQALNIIIVVVTYFAQPILG